MAEFTHVHVMANSSRRYCTKILSKTLQNRRNCNNALHYHASLCISLLDKILKYFSVLSLIIWMKSTLLKHATTLQHWPRLVGLVVLLITVNVLQSKYLFQNIAEKWDTKNVLPYNSDWRLTLNLSYFPVSFPESSTREPYLHKTLPLYRKHFENN